MGGEGERSAAAGGVIVDTVADMRELVGVLTAFTGGILFEFDRNGVYLRIWTGEPELLARPAEELLGRPVSAVLGSSAAQFHDMIRGVFDTQQPTAFDYTLDVQAGRRTFSCEARPHNRPGGGPRTVTLLVRDITAARAIEAKLLQSERLAALGLLAASVGHEVRQPLAYVNTSLDLLDRALAAEGASDGAKQSLANIRAGARRIAEIAASLDLLAGRRARAALSAIDVRSPLKAALDLCASELSGLRVTRTLTEVPLVLGDEGELCQVFTNLLLNAAQSIAPEARATATVTVTLTAVRVEAGERVRISVSDEGAGIAPEQVGRIFDPFFTTRAVDGGTGLGLFITSGIVHAHGGTVEVASNQGVGTTVDVYLPVALRSERPGEPNTGVRPKLAPAATSLEGPASGFAATLPRRRLSLLVIDDEPRFLESLRLALEDAHDVDTRTGAPEALEVLEKDPHLYDVVLCDLAMPVIDGAAFHERMEALGIADRFVLMTGGAFNARGADFLARGACPRISKPFLLERLLELLDDVTRGRSAS